MAVVPAFLRGLRLVVLLLILQIQLAGTAHGQIQLETSASYSTELQEATRSIALGDVDGDGDLDLICGNESQLVRLYRNHGRGLDVSPTWSSTQTWRTSSVSLGDIDGDGDLDLVCGNYGQSALVYRNLEGTFESTPFWTAESSAATWSIALGDIDGDGDLDLVCGNAGEPLTLYRNRGNTFDSIPDWRSDRSHSAQCVTLGDVDGDGDLDLVCGNESEKSVLYRNLGTTFERLPSWSSGPADATRSVALADVDGDGDLDLACGNFGQSVTLYRNLGSTFETGPSWFSTPADLVQTVAWGDVDADGFPDLVCGTFGDGTKIYRNDGSSLGPSPAWSSGPGDHTLCVGLADLDSDGDLELVCGNYQQSSHVFRNQAPLYGILPSWRTADPDFTRCIAVGDVDGDGDLDVVCGNEGRSSQLFEFTGGTYAQSPKWSSNRQDATRGVAFGDVDGDGDLDLVCGNYDQRITVYRNLGSTFETAPSWQSGPEDLTLSVAVGDVDDDGDLDLVSGAMGPRLYRNDGSGLAEWPSWSARATQTWCVVLMDVDSDGDLDLVCGTTSGARLYRNLAGTFEATSSWSSLEELTLSVAVGDVDGDGDDDLVCGNHRRRVTLYRNLGSTFEASPSWSSDTDLPVLSVALGDVDLDGDLDLVCGNYRGQVQMYRNNGSMLDVSPTWFASPTWDTWSIALRDVDADGDIDLVCGNHRQGTAFFRGAVTPPYRGDPLRPTYQLPNNDGYLTRVRAEDAGKNALRIRLTAVDLESDPVWLVAEYGFPGTPGWHPIDFASGQGRFGPLQTSPAGVQHSFDWDVVNLPISARPVELRLRAISVPYRTVLTRQVGVYVADLGVIRVRRPAVALSQSEIAIPTVTVGDTVVVPFSIHNVGTDMLRLSSIELPSIDLSVEPAAPVNIAPGAHVEAAISYHPVAAIASADSVWFLSNDPVAPRVSMSITTDPRDLVVRSQALATPPVPLGQAVTVQAIPTDSVIHIEKSWLVYRPRGEIEFGAAPMTRFGVAWIGVIPGEAIREGGVEYFLRLENQPVVRTHPVDGANGPDALAVRAPEEVFVRAARTSRTGFLEGRDIRIEVALPVGSDFARGTLHYRMGGERGEWNTASLSVLELGVPEATIPAAAVGPRGLEYRVEVQTSTATLTHPPGGESVAPDTLRVSVARLEEERSHLARRYRILTVPLDFGETAAGTLENLMLDEAEFGSYDPTRWRAFRYIPGTGTVELSASDSRFRPQPGRAYWLICSTEHRVDSAPLEGLSTPTHQAFPVALAPGWNQFGHPYAFPVDWSAVVHSQNVSDPVAFDSGLGTMGDYADAPPSLLQPFEGYFVENISAAWETLWVPPVEAAPSPVAPVAAGITPTKPNRMATASHWSAWRLRLGVATDQSQDASNLLGVDPRAENEFDPLDQREPPHLPGEWVALAFTNPDWKRGSGSYRHDLRPPSSEGYVWNLEVRSAAPRSVVTLQAAPETLLPAELAIRLVDLETDEVIDLVAPGSEGSAVRAAGPVEPPYEGSSRSKSEVYRLLAFGPERPYRLRVLGGRRDFVEREVVRLADVPQRLVLDPVSPNPFNSSTRIRFGIPRPDRVSLAIYTVRGERVSTLLDGEPLAAGYHTVLWRGEMEPRVPMPSGIYFCRIVAGAEVRAVRLVHVK